MESRYNVYFAGQILDGYELGNVRDNLAKVFNANEETLDKLFSGSPQLVKRDCDEATAQKYKAAMERAGALPQIKPLENPGEPQAQSDTAAPGNTEQSAGLVLAPPGADVLTEAERPQPVRRDVDTSGLEVDAAAQRLSPEPATAPPPPDTSHLDMGAVGDVIPNLPRKEAPVSVNTDGISLAPEGSDLRDGDTPEAPDPHPDLSHLEVAPAGSEVLEEQYRRKAQAQAPATDHLSLED